MELGFGLKVDYTKLHEVLQGEQDSRALETLWVQLEKYESVIKL